MIRNLGLCKRSEICLIKNIVMDLMLSKYRFGKERYIKKLLIFGKDRKKNSWILLLGGKRPFLKRMRWKYPLIWLGNDKKNVTANKV